MIAALIGSTGLAGSALLQELLADNSIDRVITVSRKALPESEPRLTQILLDDVGTLDSQKNELFADIYFCCLGTTRSAAGSEEAFERIDHDAVVQFARIARDHRAKSFTFVSAEGASVDSRFLYTRTKGRTEKDVELLGLRSLNIFRPAFLVGKRQEFRFTEKLLNKTLVPILFMFPASFQRKALTRVEDLARHMLSRGKLADAGTHLIRARDIGDAAHM